MDQVGQEWRLLSAREKQPYDVLAIQLTEERRLKQIEGKLGPNLADTRNLDAARTIEVIDKMVLRLPLYASFTKKFIRPCSSSGAPTSTALHSSFVRRVPTFSCLAHCPMVPLTNTSPTSLSSTLSTFSSRWMCLPLVVSKVSPTYTSISVC